MLIAFTQVDGSQQAGMYGAIAATLVCLAAYLGIYDSPVATTTDAPLKGPPSIRWFASGCLWFGGVVACLGLAIGNYELAKVGDLMIAVALIARWLAPLLEVPVDDIIGKPWALDLLTGLVLGGGLLALFEWVDKGLAAGLAIVIGLLVDHKLKHRVYRKPPANPNAPPTSSVPGP